MVVFTAPEAIFCAAHIVLLLRAAGGPRHPPEFHLRGERLPCTILLRTASDPRGSPNSDVGRQAFGIVTSRCRSARIYRDVYYTSSPFLSMGRPFSLSCPPRPCFYFPTYLRNYTSCGL